LRLITPDHKAGLIAGHQLNDLMRTDRGRVMHNVVVMKEAVLDFAKRHRLRLPTWWADTCDAAPSATYDTTAELVNKSEPRSLGKQPRIIKYLTENYPNGVPPPGLAPRKALKAALIRTQRPQKQNERLSGQCTNSPWRRADRGKLLQRPHSSLEAALVVSGSRALRAQIPANSTRLGRG
jgi:hypothetical protein